MINKAVITSLLFISSLLTAEIIEISNIDDVRSYVTDNGLYLFDVDDTLIDNPLTLGSPPWRAWAKTKVPEYKGDFVLYDALTLFIAKNAPYKTVEPATATLISDLQNEGHAAFAFTARGRSQWYTTDMDGVDRFTQHQLLGAGIDFSNSKVPQELENLEKTYFTDGIIFAEHIKKGDLLKHLFKDLNYTPSLIVFVDDKLDQVLSVEAAVTEANIPFVGFWYRHGEINRKEFDPMMTNIQLESLLIHGEIVDDATAKKIADSLDKAIDPTSYFKSIFEKIDVEKLAPTLP